MCVLAVFRFDFDFVETVVNLIFLDFFEYLGTDIK